MASLLAQLSVAEGWGSSIPHLISVVEIEGEFRSIFDLRSWIVTPLLEWHCFVTHYTLIKILQVVIWILWLCLYFDVFWFWTAQDENRLILYMWADGVKWLYSVAHSCPYTARFICRAVGLSGRHIFTDVVNYALLRTISKWVWQ